MWGCLITRGSTQLHVMELIKCDGTITVHVAQLITYDSAWLHVKVPYHAWQCLNTCNGIWLTYDGIWVHEPVTGYMWQHMLTCSRAWLRMTGFGYMWRHPITCCRAKSRNNAWLHVRCLITCESTWSHMMEPDYMWQHPVTCNSTRLHAMSVPTLSVIISQFHDINNWDILQTHGAGFIFKGEINQNKVLYL